MNPLTTDKKGRIALGAMILRKLKMLPDYTTAFEKRGKIVRSEEPYGFAYFIDENEQRIVNEMEKRGHTVYSVIRGKYRIGQSDIMSCTTYLYVSDEDIEQYNRNLAMGKYDMLDGIITRFEGNQYYAMANVFGFEQEYGEVVIAPRNGGLTRTY